MSRAEAREVHPREFIRPIVLGLGFSIVGEFLLLVIYGVFLFPHGDLLYKVLWALVFCGIGMGAALGALINLFVVGRYWGAKAVILTTLLSLVLLGIACNLLCLNLDRYFQYFGGATHPVSFLVTGLVLSVLAGAIMGRLLFTERGNDALTEIGL